MSAYLAAAANDDAYSPELAVIAEQARVDNERGAVRRRTPTVIRVTAVVLAA